MIKLMGCLLVTTVLLFSAPTEKSGKTLVGAELVPVWHALQSGVLDWWNSLHLGFARDGPGNNALLRGA